MRPLFFVAVIAALASGCSTSVVPTYTAGGNAGYRVTCGGMFGDGDLGSCYQAAGQQCANAGFRVLQTSVSSMIFECRTAETNKEPLLSQ